MGKCVGERVGRLEDRVMGKTRWVDRGVVDEWKDS